MSAINSQVSVKGEVPDPIIPEGVAMGLACVESYDEEKKKTKGPKKAHPHRTGLRWGPHDQEADGRFLWGAVWRKPSRRDPPDLQDHLWLPHGKGEEGEALSLLEGVHLFYGWGRLASAERRRQRGRGEMATRFRNRNRLYDISMHSRCWGNRKRTEAIEEKGYAASLLMHWHRVKLVAAVAVANEDHLCLDDFTPTTSAPVIQIPYIELPGGASTKVACEGCYEFLLVPKGIAAEHATSCWSTAISSRPLARTIIPNILLAPPVGNLSRMDTSPWTISPIVKRFFSLSVSLSSSLLTFRMKYPIELKLSSLSSWYLNQQNGDSRALQFWLDVVNKMNPQDQFTNWRNGFWCCMQQTLNDLFRSCRERWSLLQRKMKWSPFKDLSESLTPGLHVVY